MGAITSARRPAPPHVRLIPVNSLRLHHPPVRTTPQVTHRGHDGQSVSQHVRREREHISYILTEKYVIRIHPHIICARVSDLLCFGHAQKLLSPLEEAVSQIVLRLPVLGELDGVDDLALVRVGRVADVGLRDLVET